MGNSYTFLVNPGSGGGSGRSLAKALRRHAGDHKVIDLSKQTPVTKDLMQSSTVVACGGDGTATWAAELSRSDEQSRPVAIWPLGTGNDLAGYLRWKDVEPSRRRIDHYLSYVESGKKLTHDRWALTGPGLRIPFHCYFSMGVDARIALRFHRLRRRYPWLCPGGQMNKALYGLLSLGEQGIPLKRSYSGAIRLPIWTKAVLFSNIPSYAGGVTIDERIDPADGALNCHVFGPPLSQALALGGVHHPKSLGTHEGTTFTLHQAVAAQVDGEPMMLEAGDYVLSREGSSRWLKPVLQ